jgi:adenosylcobyric acid synthase
MTAVLMLQGTGSDVGKSLIVAGLCRAFARRGLAVRPFKPLNMSNNAAVAADGGEIGRAQALQARAAGIAPIADMNPVLIKPAGGGAQVVVQGRLWRGAGVATDALLPLVLDSFARVQHGADLVLVEGAGSAAEVNLRDGDIANMGFAEAADVPVALIADIERGGAIAQVVGTWTLLSDGERARLAGVIINKFRGDTRLFDGGLAAIHTRTGLGCFGIVPWFADAGRLPAEDAVGAGARGGTASAARLTIAVPLLPGIANMDDVDPLAAEPEVAVRIVEPGTALPVCDAVLLPGSKVPRVDLDVVRRCGWDIDIVAHRRRGGVIVGLCGGYQMLGTAISDPDGVEGPAGETPGLGLLDVTTVMGREKRVGTVCGTHPESGEAVQGYEIHLGETAGPDTARPLLHLGDRPDGARSADGLVQGCYLHGLFATDGFRRAWLRRLAPGMRAHAAYEASIEATLDRLAAHIEAALDLDRLLAAARRR